LKPVFEFRLGRYWLSRPGPGQLRVRKEEGKTIDFEEREVEEAIKHLFDFRLMLEENKAKLL
jgi:hypothetical protein